MSGGKYVEPFAGRGNVFWLACHLLDFEEWWLNDPWTARWFEAIQDVDMNSIPNELTEILVRLHKRDAIDQRDSDDVSVALEPMTMFSGGTGGGTGRGGCSASWKRHASLIPFKRRLSSARGIMRSVLPRITALDWDKCGLDELSSQDFVYLDPPYEHANKNIYFYDTVDHRALLMYLAGAPHLWMLSGFTSPLYKKHLGDPEARKAIRMTMDHHNKPGGRKMKMECIWTNYTIGPDGVAVRKPRRRGLINKRRIRS